MVVSYKEVDVMAEGGKDEREERGERGQTSQVPGSYNKCLATQVP
jgi:hypothetical protein